MPVSDPLLRATGLGRRVPASRAGGEQRGWLFRGVDLAVAPGERLLIEGPSGAGKTLLLRAMALLDQLDEGAVAWRGRPVAPGDVPAFRAQAAYLLQTPALVEGSVEENLRLPFRLAVRRHRAWDRERAVALLEALGSGSALLTQPASELSGGERQLVALTRTLQTEPRLLLLDEPTSSLDPERAARAEAVLERWPADGERAVVWVSHDRRQADRVATRRLAMEAGGRLIEAARAGGSG